MGWGGVGWGGGWASRRGGCRLLAAIPMVNKPTRPPTALPLPTVLPVLPADQARRVPHPRQRLPPRQLRRVRPHERQSGVCQGTRGWPPPLLCLRQRRPLRAAAALAGGQARHCRRRLPGTKPASSNRQALNKSQQSSERLRNKQTISLHLCTAEDGTADGRPQHRTQRAPARFPSTAQHGQPGAFKSFNCPADNKSLLLHPLYACVPTNQSREHCHVHISTLPQGSRPPVLPLFLQMPQSTPHAASPCIRLQSPRPDCL